jgi:hypothetical protein
MDEQRKRAYRRLLYNAMLNIRPIGWSAPSWRCWRSWFYAPAWHRRVLIAGATADWLHNLAMFSAADFQGFDEHWFWKAFEEMNRRHRIGNYRNLFDEMLKNDTWAWGPVD